MFVSVTLAIINKKAKVIKLREILYLIRKYTTKSFFFSC